MAQFHNRFPVIVVDRDPDTGCYFSTYITFEDETGAEFSTNDQNVDLASAKQVALDNGFQNGEWFIEETESNEF